VTERGPDVRCSVILRAGRPSSPWRSPRLGSLPLRAVQEAARRGIIAYAMTLWDDAEDGETRDVVEVEADDSDAVRWFLCSQLGVGAAESSFDDMERQLARYAHSRP
jgi:hypothetical protein